MRLQPLPTSVIPVFTAYSVLLLAVLVFSPPLAAERDERVSEPTPPPEPVYALIQNAETMLRGDVYVLNCGATLELPPLPLEALESGFPLIFEHKIEVQRNRRWWFDALVAQVKVRSKLEFLQLSRRYVVTRLHNGSRNSYGSLDAALEHVAKLRDFPLIESRYIKAGSDYDGLIALSLDTESLPVPLRPQVYLSSDWRVKSASVRWSIR